MEKIIVEKHKPEDGDIVNKHEGEFIKFIEGKVKNSTLSDHPGDLPDLTIKLEGYEFSIKVKGYHRINKGERIKFYDISNLVHRSDGFMFGCSAITEHYNSKRYEILDDNGKIKFSYNPSL